MPFGRCSMASHVTFATNGSIAPAIQPTHQPKLRKWAAMGRKRPAGTDHRGFPHQDRGDVCLLNRRLLMMMMIMLGYINLSPHDDDYHVTLMIIMMNIIIIMMMNMLLLLSYK
ncbi:hypothetical protein DPMN_082410 [Dreissena polymorpha]|uniref:Uncharacterized protein n=1 Tax=Dreissena polymorpha TaxID=45954 RepID=A0A9D3YAJ8_DREPO|nr:hypothetical protein DPMN_082410 [Dreissena polymorpha]